MTCNLFNSTTTGPPTANPSHTGIADTGSTGNFFTVNTPVLNKRPATVPIAIRNPDGSIMYSTHDAELDLPLLPLAARQGHVVPALASQPLVSIGQLCDAGCQVAFSATDVVVTYNDVPVLHGSRTPSTRLWHLDLTPSASLSSASLPAEVPVPVQEASNAAIGSATPAQLVAFAHAALFSPALSTLEQALRKNFIPHFPGLSLELLRKYPPSSIPMVKGHLDQVRKNV